MKRLCRFLPFLRTFLHFLILLRLDLGLDRNANSNKRFQLIFISRSRGLQDELAVSLADVTLVKRPQQLVA